MKITRDFIKITSADFIARSAYQMGKTPLLPIFAATLGAQDAFLGMIVAVSTMTGLVLKPLIGILSDRWGRRIWLIIGTLFFALMPFVYQFIHTPEQLLLVRVIHGLATAIYGPVTLAYIAELTPKNVAESLGWFGLARSGGYIVGPTIAGWLLLMLDPVTVFTIIGLISCLALFPILTLRDISPPEKTKKRIPLHYQIQRSVAVGTRTPAIWLSGTLESVTFIALYTVKAFLPIYALAAGTNVALVGVFFSVQEGAHMLLKPVGGRLGDRYGYVPIIGTGMILLSVGLALLPATTGLGLLIPAMLTGAAQALIFPATIALVTEQIDERTLGAGMGFIGMMQNLGKVIGPILGGVLIAQLGFEAVLIVLALMMLSGASILFALHRHIDQAPQLQGAGD